MPHFTPEELERLEALLKRGTHPFIPSVTFDGWVKQVFPEIANELRRLWDIEELCKRLQVMIDKTPSRTFEEVSRLEV